jgi:hypothetical protein
VAAAVFAFTLWRTEVFFLAGVIAKAEWEAKARSIRGIRIRSVNRCIFSLTQTELVVVDCNPFLTLCLKAI